MNPRKSSTRWTDTGSSEAISADGGAVSAPLPERVRHRLEYSFGVGLGTIRVARFSAGSMPGLEAAACGNLVIMSDDAPPPDTGDGLSLIAHEVAHCIQQGAWGRHAPAGAGPIHINDPELEEAADWAASFVVRGQQTPEAIRDIARTWRPTPSTTVAPLDCGFRAALRSRAIALPGAHIQARIAGGTTYYGGDTPICPACSTLTVGTAHELASSLLSNRLCENLKDALTDLSGKSAVERTGSESSKFRQHRKAFSSLADAIEMSSTLSKGYMIGVLITTGNHVYGASSGPADMVPDAFDTAIAMVNMKGCKDDLDPDRLRTRGGRRIDPALVYPAPRSNPPGNCAAPKLIQQCYADGHTPAFMTEMFFETNSPVHGQIIESCDTCKNLLPPMLCPSV